MPQNRRKWYEMTRAAAGNRATVRIYGDIGDSWWGDSVSASSFTKELDELGDVKAIDLHLNSPGGDAFDGVTIMNVLRAHDAAVTVYVDGLAASAASVIAMAGDEVIMGRGSQMMIHDAGSFAFGNSEDLRKAATVLDSISDSMADVYAERTGESVEDMRAAMREETWYSADEAVKAGLADKVTSRKLNTEDEDDDDEDAAAEAMSRSRFAARFRYHGRAAAPAPTILAKARARTREDGPVAKEFSDEDWKALTEKLGLTEDAEPGDVIDAVDDGAADDTVDEVDEKNTDEEKADELVDARLPAGVVAVDKSAWSQLQADAAAGRAAREEQVKARRDEVVAKALREGRITADTRKTWRAELDRNEEGTTALLATLGVAVPTSALGHDDGSTDADMALSADDIRSHDIQSWRF